MKEVWIVQEESDYEDEGGAIIGVYGSEQKAIDFVEHKGFWYDHEKQRKRQPEQFVSISRHNVE